MQAVNRLSFCSLIMYGAVSYASGWQLSFASYFAAQLKMMPVYALFLILMANFDAFSAAFVLSLVVMLIGSISKVKAAANGEPLGFYDFFAISEAKHLPSYASLTIVLLSILLFSYLLHSLLSLYNDKSKRKISYVEPFAGLLAFSLCLYPYFDDENYFAKRVSQVFAERFNLKYIGWNMAADVDQNGLPFHLIYTSKKRLIDNFSRKEMGDFNLQLSRYSSPSNIEKILPRKIIYILCEACWDTQLRGYSDFSPLLHSGFKMTEMISPVYGGGTANSEFEVFTGLPSWNLTGYIYQEYRKEISGRAITFVSEMRRLHYKAYASHNFYKYFYHRNEIYPKFGFEKYVALDDMNYKGRDNFPRDALLFNAAEQILGRPDERVFLSAVTVSTHGPYIEVGGDGGLGHYTSRLKMAVEDMAAFVKSMDSKQLDYTIVIYGDHKPAITKFFYDSKILPSSVFRKTGASNKDFLFAFDAADSQDIIGKVPVLIKSSNEERDENLLISELKDKPLFCLTPLFGSWLGIESDPSFKMMGNICRNPAGRYKDYKDKYPDQLYYRNLFS